MDTLFDECICQCLKPKFDIIECELDDIRCTCHTALNQSECNFYLFIKGPPLLTCFPTIEIQHALESGGILHFRDFLNNTQDIERMAEIVTGVSL